MMNSHDSILNEMKQMSKKNTPEKRPPGWQRFVMVLLAVLSVLCFSCGHEAMFDEVKQIPGEMWNVDDTLFFTVEVEDTISPYDVIFELHHSIDYSFSNLFVFMTTNLPDGNMHRDTLEFLLADHEGNWFGQGFSKLKFNTFTIGSKKVFADTGTYIFGIQHAMRVDDLSGIRDIGLRVGKSE